MHTSAYIDNDLLKITRDEEVIYTIAKNQLADITPLVGKNISKWVRQLLEKTWADNPLLYKVGLLIQQTYPINNINWQDTFYMVEKKDFINQSFEMKKTLETGTNDNDFIEYFQFANSGLNKEMDESILEIVSQQLRHYKIVE